MQPVNTEIRIAEKAIERMEAATNLEIEDEWKNFLGALERIWRKVERACQPQVNTFQPWQGEYARLRKKDQLLRYLKNARDVEDHTIYQTLKEMESESLITIGGPGDAVYIKKLNIDRGKIVEYDGSHPLTFTYKPERLELTRVKNNSKWYNPPLNHLGKPINDQNPVAIAKLGLEFYKDFSKKVTDKFFAEP